MMFHFLLCWFHIVVVAASEQHIRNYVEANINQGKADGASVPIKRICEIYSHSTGKLVQIRGRKVDANGAKGDKYAKMEVSSIAFGGRITIRGVETGRYLCMNKKGRLLARKRTRPSCTFTEKMTASYKDMFQSVRKPKWYIAFKDNGNPKKGPKTSPGQDEVLFLKIPSDRSFFPTRRSPSALDQNSWSKLKNEFREDILTERNPLMQADDPKMLIHSGYPLDVLEEIERRHKETLENTKGKSTSLPPQKENRRNKKKDKALAADQSNESAHSDVTMKTLLNKKLRRKSRRRKNNPSALTAQASNSSPSRRVINRRRSRGKGHKHRGRHETPTTHPQPRSQTTMSWRTDAT